MKVGLILFSLLILSSCSPERPKPPIIDPEPLQEMTSENTDLNVVEEILKNSN